MFQHENSEKLFNEEKKVETVQIVQFAPNHPKTLFTAIETFISELSGPL